MDDKVAALLRLTGTVLLEGGDVLYNIHLMLYTTPSAGKSWNSKSVTIR